MKINFTSIFIKSFLFGLFIMFTLIGAIRAFFLQVIR